MRISDWSSDVCSSDLSVASSTLRRAMYAPLIDLDAPPPPVSSPLVATLVERTLADLAEERRLAAALPGIGATNCPASQQVRAQYESHPYPRWQAPPTPRPAALRARSEEHTSELQS